MINHKTVLTVAHCIRDKTFNHEFEFNKTILLPIIWNKFYSSIESTISVYIGLHSIHEIFPSRRVFVRKIIKHPNNCNLIHDIAIIQLDELITKNNKVGFACLPPTQNSQYPAENIFSAVIGWGKQDENQTANPSKVLNNVGIDILAPQFNCGRMASSICKKFYMNFLLITIVFIQL